MMKRTKLERTQIALERNRHREQELLQLLNVDFNGFVIYDGPGPISERTGSSAQILIDWYLYRDAKEKPLDAEMFVKMMDKKLT